jgi:hypothetical protein
MIYTLICVAVVSACFGVIFGEDFKRKVCRHRGQRMPIGTPVRYRGKDTSVMAYRWKANRWYYLLHGEYGWKPGWMVKERRAEG